MEPTVLPGGTFERFAVPLAILVAGALIGVGVFFGLHQGSGGSGAPVAPKVNIKDVKISESNPYIGDKNAPVTLAYWFDYQCPFCKAVDVGGVAGIPIEPSIPTLITDYVNTGKVKIVFKDFAFLGEDSITAASYEHAIWELYPAKFLEWHTAMFKAQDDEGDQGFGDGASIIVLTRKIPGIDADQVKAHVMAKKDTYAKMIEEDRNEAAKFGINGTPGFITGKVLISGAEQLSVFKQAIDQQL